MTGKTTPPIPPSEITPKSVYLARREVMFGAAAAVAGSALVAGAADAGPLTAPLGKFSTMEPQTRKSDATSYNNFTEFGSGKTAPSTNSGKFKPTPWAVTIDGLCAKPGKIALEDLYQPSALEERIYRLRCVEGWSMVIPWIGFPLADVIRKAEPQGSAKYVMFETIVRPAEMPGQRGVLQSLDWPYREGLRLDEALNPLTLLAVGMYGETLPNQNGAPIRLVVPWKYGFKSIKSIVRISFVEKEPVTTWNKQQPEEYGFFANVNPEVDHPRWSQATERRIGGGLIQSRRPTQMFNGYGEQVASLYAGMDLRANY